MTLRVAVVGSGPAGFYAAGRLLEAEEPVEVDMIERLPTPWGLVRLGVAPDHPKIKAVSRTFERIAAQRGFRFLGGVEVGRDLAHEDLARLYDAVVYAVGAQSDRRMGIPGEDLPGSWSATEFVAWYNGHPDYQDFHFDLSGERAVVVGAGNVALDVVRMLALAPDEIRPTDTTDEAIEAILGSGIGEIVLLARRGPAQAAFTTPELKELGELTDADVVVDAADLELDDASTAALEHDTNARRNVEVLREYAARTPLGRRRVIRLRFAVSPVAIHGEERVEAIEIVRNRLVADENGRVRAEPTGERETIPCGIVFRSVGYLGVELPGVPFDARRATIPNECGRVTGAAGVYCAGWIKRGPSGVIGTNKKDATETIDLLLEDARAGKLGRGDPSATADTVDDLLASRGVEHVTYAGWEAIDAEERGRGEPQGRPRVKLITWDDLRAAARSIATT
ncbi:MAG: FAD-dependent oxidoreductase [Verrucomicrobiota bacterium]